ncbi:MAG TPA: ATP-binding protein [Steroidobacteraceae bacterium]|nr:ATP-binding protein [Steroidobacteraceae bacterium]
MTADSPGFEEDIGELFEHAPCGYVVAHTDGRIIRANATMAALIGESAELLIRRRFQDLLTVAGRIYYDTHVRPLLAMQGFVREMAFDLKAAGGERTVPVVMNAVQRLDAEGRPCRLRITVFDATERRQYERELLFARRAADEARETEKIAREQAERAVRAKDDFLALVSHELRSPLAAILGWTQVLRRVGNDAEKVAQGLDVIERNTKMQSRLVEDLLDMSRMVAGKLRMDVQEVSLADVIHEAVETVGPSALARHVRLQKILDPHVRVSGDPGRLQQVFWNLLSNAIKFTPADGFVRVVMERVNSHIEVSVVDSGQGMSVDVMAHAFERFRQSTGPSARKTEGLGLGLSIVKHLVEMHGGSISAHSAGVGQGSTFLIKLPLRAADTGNLRHPQAAVGDATARSRITLRGLKIMVVDDDKDAREVLWHILSDRGAEVVVCESAQEGLVTIQRVVPDVLVSDIGMPGEDGLEFIRKVRLLGDAVSRIPAVALTAFSHLEDRTQALLAGFQAHLAKPVDAQELIVNIAAIAGRSLPERNAQRTQS